jgi:hypothetical protein
MWAKEMEQIMPCAHVDDSFVTASRETTLIKFRNRMLSCMEAGSTVQLTWMKEYGIELDEIPGERLSIADSPEVVGFQWPLLRTPTSSKPNNRCEWNSF